LNLELLDDDQQFQIQHFIDFVIVDWHMRGMLVLSSYSTPVLGLKSGDSIANFIRLSQEANTRINV
jgi:hypothetical protein